MTEGSERYWEARWRDADKEIERLKAALRDCADDLEAYVENHYQGSKQYPGELRRYERDIEPVRKARAALEEGK